MRLTKEEILSIIDYDRKEGLLRWKVKRGSTVNPGDIAGTETSYGSLQMSLHGKRIQVSHVIWFLETGEWPYKSLDHINRNPKDNRFENLRHVSQEINVLHEINKNSEEGIYQTSGNKFCVIIKKQGISICVGSYKTSNHAQDILDSCRLIMKDT